MSAVKSKKEFNSFIQLRIAQSQIMQWKHYANEHGWGVSDMIRKATDDYIARDQKTDRARQIPLPLSVPAQK